MKIKKIILLIAILAVSNSKMLSQHWGTAGNATLPPIDAVTAASYIGTNIAVPFNLQTILAQPINFSTNSTQRMTILGTTGFVGINIAAPNQLLTVDAGNINTNTTSNGYMIGKQKRPAFQLLQQ
jgi:hypothetical protein